MTQKLTTRDIKKKIDNKRNEKILTTREKGKNIDNKREIKSNR
jgi:hypothetical protein